MTNQFVVNRLEGVRKGLLAFFESGVGQSSISGDEREIFISHFLSQILPPQYRVGSGLITDAQGKLSTQLDIVIELPFTPSFSFLATTPRLYLADTIGAVIEVKSSLKGYLTGSGDSTAEKKFVTGSSKFTALVEIKRKVLVVDKAKVDKELKTEGHVSETIPSYIVGYIGQSEDTLIAHLNNLNQGGKVIRGILQLDPGIFIGSGGEIWRGGQALGGFIHSLHWELHRTSPLSWPDLPSYFGLK